MKKFVAAVLSVIIFSLPVLAEIKDDFIERSLDKNLTVKRPFKVSICDDFVEKTLDKKLKIKPVKYSSIIDYFAENNLNKNIVYGIIIDMNESIPIIQNNTVGRKFQNKMIIDTKDLIPVKLKIKNKFSTKSNIDEGDYIEFLTVEDVKINKKIYPRNTTVKARIETISKNESMGVPSDLVVGNFSIDDMDLYGEINKIGANRTLWVYPLAYVGSMFFFAGLIFSPIRGGHAKISPKEIFTLYLEK